MDVMRRLPPADTHATAQASNKCADKCIDNRITGNASVTSIVSYKHDLVLRKRQLEMQAKSLALRSVRTQKIPRKRLDAM